MSDTTTMHSTPDDKSKMMTIVIEPDLDSVDAQSYKSTGIRSKIGVYFSGKTAASKEAPSFTALDDKEIEAVQSILSYAVKEASRFRFSASNLGPGSNARTLSKRDTERLCKDLHYFVKSHTSLRDPRFGVLVCSAPQSCFTDETLVPNTRRIVDGTQQVVQ